MSDIKVEINYTPNSENSNIDYENSIFPNINNISSINGLKTDFKGANPFLLGVSKFSDNCEYINEYDGIITYNSSDINGNCDYTMTINGKNMSAIAINFDKTLMEYATKIVINNVEYENEDLMFIKMFEMPTSQFVIKFTKWSKPNRPIVIDAFYLSIIKEYNKKQISNLVIGQETAGNNNNVSFGVVGKYGSFNLLNIQDEINPFINNRLLNSKTKVVIKYNDNVIGNFTSKSWNLSDTKKSFKVELNDLTYNFGNINVPIVDLKEKQNAFDLFSILFSYTGLKSYNIGYEIFKRIIDIQFDTLFINEKRNLMDMLNYFCELTMTNIIINNQNELEVLDYV